MLTIYRLARRVGRRLGWTWLYRWPTLDLEEYIDHYMAVEDWGNAFWLVRNAAKRMGKDDPMVQEWALRLRDGLRRDW